MKLVMEVELGRGDARAQCPGELIEAVKASMREGLRDHPSALPVILMTDFEVGMGGPMLNAYGQPSGGKWEVVE